MTTKLQWNFRIKDFVYLFLYLSCLFIALIHLPKSIWIYYEARTAIIGLGILGIWRYIWWLTHVCRSLIFSHFVFPKRRLNADRIWNEGWRPKQLFFMLTTFNEIPSTTERVLQSIINECEDIQVPVKLFVGTGSNFDETIIQKFIEKLNPSFNLEVILVRQSLPGKRFAIGSTLRAITQSQLNENDPVVFMDGDTFLEPGCLRKCLPFFPLHPKMQALTTYENAIVNNGPLWMKKWLEMR